MAAVALGVRRMGELLERLGAAVVADALGQLLARTERLVRARLAATFPRGTHRFTDAIDADGHGNGPFRIRLALTRTAQDRFILDATETDDQASGPVNFLMNRDVPGMALGLYFLGGDPAQVANAGGPRALDEVRLREGSLLAPRFPAPLGLRGLTMMRVLAALNGLVTWPAAAPRHPIPPMSSSCCAACADGAPFLMSDGVGVGYGARPSADGHRCGLFRRAGELPGRVPGTRLSRRESCATGSIADSGGPGRFRGGCGVVREYEILAEEAMLALRIDGVENPPWGVAGGMQGGTGRAAVNPGTPGERVLVPLSDGTILRRGDILRLETGGGGGHGHPFDRPAAQVLRDVLGGFVSRAAAERDYGVVLDGEAIDPERTRARRSLRPHAGPFHRHGYVDALT